jgi:hypothetical protein
MRSVSFQTNVVPASCHLREGGNPEPPSLSSLDSRFRGNDNGPVLFLTAAQPDELTTAQTF